MIKFYLPILICFLYTNIYSQENHYKINNGYQRLSDDRMVSSLSFSVENDYKDFLTALETDFGKANFENYFYVWKKIKVKNWSKRRCTLRVQVSHVKGFNEEWKNITITLETRKKNDLLEVNTDSYIEVIKYFTELVNNVFLK